MGNGPCCATGFVSLVVAALRHGLWWIGVQAERRIGSASAGAGDRAPAIAGEGFPAAKCPGVSAEAAARFRTGAVIVAGDAGDWCDSVMVDGESWFTG